MDPVTQTDQAGHPFEFGGAAENPSIVTALAVVSALVGSGVSDFAYCPGSRNAPFAYVLAQLEAEGLVRVHPFVEERGAGFWAIGAMKASPSTPVAVVTTSGTAVAELHPAVIEARHQGLPLVVVTADRPFEAHLVGANQTTNQVGIFAGAPVAEVNVPALGTDTDSELVRKLHRRVQRAIMLAKGLPGLPGPAHINVALREPLVPADPRFLGEVASLVSQDSGPVPVARPSQTPWSAVVDPSLRTLLVVGDAEGSSDKNDVRLLATRGAELGIPMIAEPSSGVTDLPNWLPHGPLIADRLARGVQQLVVLGRPTLSRALGRLMRTQNVRKVVVGNTADWSDESGTATVYVDRLRPDPSDDAGLRSGDLSESDLDEEKRDHRQWLQFCTKAAGDAESVVAEISGAEDDLNHLSAVRTIWGASTDIALWLGASNTIRAFDLAAAGRGVRFAYSNRGLAGIDGTIASSLGLQSGLGMPVRAVMGDLTFCYDLPSLAARPDGEQNIQVIVFDDGGGSIFSSLEHGTAANKATYDKFFGVRQHIEPCVVAEGCGWSTRRISTMEELRGAVGEPVVGRSLLQVRLPVPAEMIRALNKAAADL